MEETDDSIDLLKKVRQIEIKTRGLSNHIFAGEYHSAFKGRGMSFSEVREYQYGDDVRNIDWNVTARMNKPYIKVFEEERENTVVLLVDVSGSREFGTRVRFKKNLVTEMAATLAFSTIQNNDKVGVLFFSDHVEQFIPPNKGKKHVLHIIRELLMMEPSARGTDVGEALRYFTNAIKKRSTAFLISDLIDDGPWDQALTIASHKHDLIALRVSDRRESELSDLGLAYVRDAETGRQRWVDTSQRALREAYRQKAEQRAQRIDETLSRAGVDNVTVDTSDDYVKALLKLFGARR